jgi:hypothetical protein
MPFTAGSAVGRVASTLDFGIPNDWGKMSPRGKIYPAVAASLAQRSPWPHTWTSRERSQQRRLYVAALQDLAGITDDPVRDRDSTSRDRDARDGRVLWAALGAWPWSLYGPKGSLPRDWHQDDAAVWGWNGWLTGF